MIRIASEFLHAEIDPMGAELAILRDGQGRDLLWNGDAKFWTGRAPLLFPIVGALNAGRYRLGDQSYPMAKHGFARRKRFQTVAATNTSASLVLEADSSTSESYPFSFRLEASFVIRDRELAMTVSITNPSGDLLPASFGFHPAFRWPLPGAGDRADHTITFDLEEPEPIRRLDAAGLIRPLPCATPVEGRTLRLKDDLFVEDAIIFDRPASRGLRYGGTSGTALKIGFPTMSFLGVWTKPGAGFIAIEPWAGLADPEGFSGDFRDKPGILLLAPGETRRFEMTVAISDQPPRT
jgi:galactose mutarotase-like enzyme